MLTLKEQIAAIMTPLQLSSVATIADGKPWVRYVMTVGGDDLTVRFATFAGSRKVAQIAANPEVHVTLGVNDPAVMNPYLQIQGRARFSTEAAERHGADRPAVIGRALEAGVTRILLPGINLGSSRRCVELAAENSPLYAAVGLHPTEAESLPADALNQLRDLARRPKVVAVGEIGLDYYWVHDAEQQSRQRELLRRQLLVAAEFNQPVVIHAREKDDAEGGPCAEDLLSMLESWIADRGHAVQQAKPPGVLHSFSSSLEAARRAIGMGFYIGVTGPITYKNASG